jgi:hypothetical protein
VSGAGSKSSWIPEVGRASARQPSGLSVGRERQAEYLISIFERAPSGREHLRLRSVIWYAMSYTQGPAPARGTAGSSDWTAQAKPSGSGLLELTGGSA